MDEKKLYDLLVQISSDHGEIKDGVNNMAIKQAEFAATLKLHMEQDEKMNEELHRVRDCMIKNTRELSEYNTQLQIHIKGTEDNRRSIEESNKRIVALEGAQIQNLIHQNTINVSYKVLAKVGGVIFASITAAGVVLKFWIFLQ